MSQVSLVNMKPTSNEIRPYLALLFNCGKYELGTAQRSKYLFTEGLPIAVDIVMMSTRIFSSFLDPQKAWFALNDKLCKIPPRKFCINGIFNLFPKEICHVNIGDLRDSNGGQVALMSFNQGAKGTDAIYADTTFAVLAGNLRRKDPGEGEFFKSALFKRLRKVVNNVELIAGDEFENTISEQNPSENIDSSGRCDSFMEDLTDLPTASSSAALREDDFATSHSSLKSLPNDGESPQKCSTPNSSCSSSPASTSSSPSGSLPSVEEIENSTLGPPTKKRKIRKKVETVMGDVTSLC